MCGRGHDRARWHGARTRWVHTPAKNVDAVKGEYHHVVHGDGHGGVRASHARSNPCKAGILGATQVAADNLFAYQLI